MIADDSIPGGVLTYPSVVLVQEAEESNTLGLRVRRGLELFFRHGRHLGPYFIPSTARKGKPHTWRPGRYSLFRSAESGMSCWLLDI